MIWHDWSPEVFAEAAAEHRLVLVDVGAVWCHWCHVMDEETYANPEVQAKLSEHYLVVRIDSDARPDLARRWEDWGWPATIVLAPDGTELGKFRGYLPPARFGAILDAFAADPTPGPSALVPPPEPTAFDREALLARWDARWDAEAGGWGRVTKALDARDVALAEALGTPERLARAREALALGRRLIDPAWGGVYQYSDSGDWEHPHFEKLATFQADDLRIYAWAFQRWGDPADRAAAVAIHAYIAGFLADPAGGYAASQDADLVPGEHAAAYFAGSDAARRAAGVPRLDPHRYAATAGKLSAALADASGWLGEPVWLGEARAAAAWVLATRALPGGGFSHEAEDPAGPWLDDTLSCGEAFLALYTATGDPAWRDRAVAALGFVDRHFRAPDGGFYASETVDAPGLPRVRDLAENARTARLALAAARATDAPDLRALAEHAEAYVEGASGSGAAVEVLLAARAFAEPPLHAVVIGPRGDPRARALLDAARALPALERRIEVRDPAGPPLPADAQGYPDSAAPTLFVCAGSACSPPLTEASAVRPGYNRLLAR